MLTPEERLDRIEHVTAGLAEQFLVEREENRKLWRDTQRQMAEMDARLGERIEQLADESRAADRLLSQRIDQLAQESCEADRRLGGRIDALVSAIGTLLEHR